MRDLVLISSYKNLTDFIQSVNPTNTQNVFYVLMAGRRSSIQSLGQYGLKQARDIADYKTVSLNVFHVNMEITDQFYSNINDGEVQSRISELGKEAKEKEQDDFALFQKFLEWERKNRWSD